MKKFSFLILIHLVCMVCAVSVARANPPFTIGEKLTYNVSFANFSDAAYLETQVVGRGKIENQDALWLRGKIRTAGFVQTSLLQLDSEYSSFVTPERNLPLSLKRTVLQDGKEVQINHSFTENPAGNLFDILSAVYQIRTLPLAIGTTQSYKIWENNKTYDIELKVTERKTVTTTVGAFNVLSATVTMLNDDAFNRQKMQICFSEDERHLPVVFKMKLPKGEIRAEIASVQIVASETGTGDAQNPTAAPTPTPQITPTPTPTPQTPIPKSTPRPVATPKPYVDNQPLAPDLPFALGENLLYDVTKANQKVGAVSLEVKERKQFFGKDSVALIAKVTESRDNNIFRVGDVLNSYIQPESLVPLRTEIKLGGNLSKYSQTLTFDQELGAVTNEKAVRYEIPVGTHDFLSFAFALRAFQYDFGKNARDTKAAVLIENEPTILALRPIQKEIIEINGKKVPAILLVMTFGDGQIDGNAPRLWLSDDVRRVPLRFIVSTANGVLQADLKSQIRR